MVSTILSIAVGGALGAVSRYGVNMSAIKLFGDDFTHSQIWGTLFVNVLGSFLMGALVVTFDQLWQPGQNVRLLLLTGFLGAFTTFSAFSLDVSILYERGALLPAFGYIVGSVVLSIAALFAGLILVRTLLT
ncbi:MAG: fluoride efflux transporter CrcB [Pseudomonadota bacterium]